MTTMRTAELLEAVSHSVAAKLGLHYPPERWADLERGLGGAAKELGRASVEAYARELASGEFDQTQIDSLAGQLTIGETYFMRDPKAFEALESHILPALIQERRGGTKMLRIWSAGCCTGEEAYSIAFVLRRTIPDIDDWRVTVLATDLNPKFLHKAAQGIYGQWSFRGVSEADRSAFTRRSAEGKFEVLPVIRKMVTFGALNLVEDGYPSLTTNTQAMDIIFCRNVMMYFSPEQVRKVVAGLNHSLMEGGWLFVNASEASQQTFAEFSPAGFAGTAIYRKGAPPARVSVAAPPTVVKAPAKLVTPPVIHVSQPREPVAPPPDHAAEARRLANAGDHAAALAACDRAIEQDRLVASSHYLRGVILQEQNAVPEAIQAIKHALYLDHDFVVAHFMLGNLMLREGRRYDAVRCFDNARRLLQKYPRAAELPEADGITAERLLAILTTMQEVAE